MKLGDYTDSIFHEVVKSKILKDRKGQEYRLIIAKAVGANMYDIGAFYNVYDKKDPESGWEAGLSYKIFTIFSESDSSQLFDKSTSLEKFVREANQNNNLFSQLHL